MSTWRPTGGNEGRDGVRPLRSALDAVMRSLGGPDADHMAVVFKGWGAAVGEYLSAHTEPVALRDGTLIVAVADSAWATQLRFLEAEILERLAQAAGGPVAERIEVRVRPTPGARRSGDRAGRRGRPRS